MASKLFMVAFERHASTCYSLKEAQRAVLDHLDENPADVLTITDSDGYTYGCEWSVRLVKIAHEADYVDGRR